MWCSDTTTSTTTATTTTRLYAADGQLVTWCTECDIRRPARSAHCYFCNVCIRGRDHHCVWYTIYLFSVYTNNIVVAVAMAFWTKC